jgi:hypothetical protein
MNADDVIRDHTEHDPDMAVHWKTSGRTYVLYRIVHVGKAVVNCARMASPSHPATSETVFKNFQRSDIKKVSQTIGIYEVG